MRKLMTVATVALAAVAMAAPAAEARSGYCSPSGDYCTSVSRPNGKVLLRIGTFSFSGKVRLCVRPPRGDATCKLFRLRRSGGGILAASKGWAKHFPDRGKGTYRVRWQKFGGNLGPALTFKR